MAERGIRHALFQCRLCWRVALTVFLSILAIEAAILIPSYKNYERDLLARLSDTGLAAISGGFRTNANASHRDLLIAARLILDEYRIRGAAIYDMDGKPIGTVGEAPDLTPPMTLDGGPATLRSKDETRYDVHWLPRETGLPFAVVGRLEASWIQPELIAFTWRIAGLVLLISVFVTGVTMVILDRQVLRPMLNLGSAMSAAESDPANADQYTLGQKRSDELGDIVESLNALLRRLSQARKDDLRESEQRFRDFAATSSDWFWEMDGHLRFSYFSSRFTQLTGVPEERLLGKTRRETGIPNVDPVVWQEHLETLDKHLPFRNFVHPRTLENGDVVWVSINGDPRYDDDGVFIGYRGTGSNITEQRRAEEAILAAKEHAEAANRAKSEFLANMSHELRTPLNAIIGFSEVILKDSFGPIGNDRYSEYVNDIHESGHHLLALINDILDLAKIEAGKLELHEEQVDIGETVAACLSLIGARAEENGLQLTDDIDADHAGLVADARKLKQILINLLSNAIKFTPAGGSVRVRTRVEKNGDLAIAVIDTGIGMAPEDVPKALSPFVQIDGKLDRKYQGTGLGLPLAKSLVELHGGTLEMKSAVDRGTTAIARFPANRVNKAAA